MYIILSKTERENIGKHILSNVQYKLPKTIYKSLVLFLRLKMQKKNLCRKLFNTRMEHFIKTYLMCPCSWIYYVLTFLWTRSDLVDNELFSWPREICIWNDKMSLWYTIIFLIKTVTRCKFYRDIYSAS